MSATYEVDRFTQPQAIAEFRDRQRLVHATVGALGLRGVGTERPALAFGGGAWAMYGIDGYTGDKPFDLDVVAPDDMFERLREEDQLASIAVREGLVHGKVTARSGTLPVDVFTSSEPAKLRLVTGGVPYLGEATAATDEIDGLHVVRPGLVAQTKGMSVDPGIRQLASLIKAQVVSVELGTTPDDVMWTLSVASAIEKLSTPGPWIPPQPSWVREQVENGFAHAAFANIPRF